MFCFRAQAIMAVWVQHLDACWLCMNMGIGGPADVMRWIGSSYPTS